MAEEPNPPQFLVLPNFIHSKEQVLELVKEILRIQEFLNQTEKRTPGTKMNLPRTTADLDKFAEANKRNVLNHTQRREMAHFLRSVYNLAPVVNIYFAIDENPKFVEGVINWFRSNVHAQTLFQTHAHAKVGPGCVVRLKHKTYDFSFRKRFDQAQSVLEEALQVSTPVQTQTTQRAQYF
jgi:hypothetical protein